MTNTVTPVVETPKLTMLEDITVFDRIAQAMRSGLDGVPLVQLDKAWAKCREWSNIQNHADEAEGRISYAKHVADRLLDLYPKSSVKRATYADEVGRVLGGFSADIIRMVYRCWVDEASGLPAPADLRKRAQAEVDRRQSLLRHLTQERDAAESEQDDGYEFLSLATDRAQERFGDTCQIREKAESALLFGDLVARIRKAGKRLGLLLARGDQSAWAWVCEVSAVQEEYARNCDEDGVLPDLEYVAPEHEDLFQQGLALLRAVDPDARLPPISFAVPELLPPKTIVRLKDRVTEVVGYGLYDPVTDRCWCATKADEMQDGHWFVGYRLGSGSPWVNPADVIPVYQVGTRAYHKRHGWGHIVRIGSAAKGNCIIDFDHGGQHVGPLAALVPAEDYERGDECYDEPAAIAAYSSTR